MGGLRPDDRWRIIEMTEKFLGLSKAVRWLIVLLTWLLTVAGFVGCLIIKEYALDLYWLEIILTCVGLFFCIVAICITIVHLTGETKHAQ